jgi:hypothetical protein
MCQNKRALQEGYYRCKFPFMPKFTVEHQTNLSREEAYKKIQDYLQDSQDLRKWDSSLEAKFDATAMTGEVKGSKFECSVEVIGNSPTNVALHISLPFLLTPFKGKIEEMLKKTMTKLLV